MNELTTQERDLILAGLFELRIRYLESDERCAAIDALAVKFGGDPGAMFFGIDPAALPKAVVG